MSYLHLVGNGGELNTNNTGIIREVNIFSGTFERGYGTSLVYYAVRNHGWTNSGIAPLGEVQISIGRYLAIVAGGTFHTFAYNIEHGYDRYDAFQVRDTVPFASARIYQPYAGIRIGERNNFEDDETLPKTIEGGGYFTAGPLLLQPFQFSSIAQGTQVQKATGLQFNLGLYFNGAFVRAGKLKPKAQKK
jgi:hypothetical protein